jgi:hypothetical protein
LDWNATGNGRGNTPLWYFTKMVIDKGTSASFSGLNTLIDTEGLDWNVSPLDGVDSNKSVLYLIAFATLLNRDTAALAIPILTKLLDRYIKILDWNKQCYQSRQYGGSSPLWLLVYAASTGVPGARTLVDRLANANLTLDWDIKSIATKSEPLGSVRDLYLVSVRDLYQGLPALNSEMVQQRAEIAEKDREIAQLKAALAKQEVRIADLVEENDTLKSALEGTKTFKYRR